MPYFPRLSPGKSLDIQSREFPGCPKSNTYCLGNGQSPFKNSGLNIFAAWTIDLACLLHLDLFVNTKMHGN